VHLLTSSIDDDSLVFHTVKLMVQQVFVLHVTILDRFLDSNFSVRLNFLPDTVIKQPSRALLSEVIVHQDSVELIYIHFFVRLSIQ
jgi:hypothetical protein